MQLVDWLDDLCVRFIINLPREELESVERICFQVEEAQWFYEDFIRPLDPTLPSLTLKQFCLKIFQHCPLFAGYDDQVFSAAFSEFLAYKTRVPVRGAIMLNETMDAAVLVKGWKKSASWSFPRGKINKDEKDIDCAIREVYEETGYDVRAAGLIVNEDDVKSIEITMREQHMKLFVFPGVPMETHFEPRTRKEISKIEWYKLSDLPALKKTKHQQSHTQEHELSKNASKFYMVAPFMGPLKKYIAQLKKQDVKSKPTAHIEVPTLQLQQSSVTEMVIPPTDDMSRLMAQLRQSQQASRENNYPEVTGPEDFMKDASLQLKNLLNLAPMASVAPTQVPVLDDSAVRESKAKAMLSLLQGGPPPRRESAELPPETPFDQIMSEPVQPPSPKYHPHRVARAPMFSAPPAFPFSPPRLAEQPGHPFFANQPNLPGHPLHLQHFHNRPDQPPHLPNGQPPMWRQEQGNPQGASFLGGDRQATAAPAANRLPLPKLNAHSSKLLDLFKQGPTSPRLPQLPADSPRPELSASRPATGGMAQFPFGRPGVAEGIRPSYALASPSTGPSLRSGQKTPSQQETLLSLFKGSTFPGKSSPSLASPLAPVELSANPESVRVDTSQVPENVPHEETRGPVRNISPLTEDERPFKLPLTGGPDLSPDLSATVTGPLGEMHFDTMKSINQKHRTKLQESPRHLSPKASSRSNTKTDPPQQIRILPRPGTSPANAPPPPQQGPRSPRPKKLRENKESQKEKPAFQPQILKRPAAGPSSAGPNLPAPTPKSFPQQLLDRSAVLDGMQPPSHSSDSQKAQLLSLFGARKSETPPVMSASALPVSPLSERPPPESTLPSPLALNGRSRIGSLQSVTGGDQIALSGSGSFGGSGKSTPKPVNAGGPTSAPIVTTPRAGPPNVTSPVDRTFLLGFLDGVAKEGAR